MRRILSLISLVLLLLASLLQAGCADPDTFFELGPLFAPTTPPPGQARIYVYRPALSAPSRGVYQLKTPMTVEQLLPGGYLSRSAAPGKMMFQVARVWQPGAVWHNWPPLLSQSTTSMVGPKLAISVEAEHVYYLRIASVAGLIDQLAVELVAGEVGKAEISHCSLLQWKARFGRPARVDHQPAGIGRVRR